MHGGRCIGTNLCKCAPGLSGDHCEIGQKQRPTCKDNCKFGHCMSNNKCKCLEGYYGRFCNRRKFLYNNLSLCIKQMTYLCFIICFLGPKRMY